MMQIRAQMVTGYEVDSLHPKEGQTVFQGMNYSNEVPLLPCLVYMAWLYKTIQE